MNKKFNVIDLIVIILVIAIVAAAAFFYFKVADSTDETGSGQAVTLDFVIEVAQVSESQANEYKIGEKIFFGKTMAQGIIKDVKVTPYKMIVENTIDGEYVLAEMPDLYTVVVTVEADCVKTDKEYLCNGESISVGKGMPVAVKTAASETCYVIDMLENLK